MGKGTSTAALHIRAQSEARCVCACVCLCACVLSVSTRCKQKRETGAMRETVCSGGTCSDRQKGRRSDRAPAAAHSFLPRQKKRAQEERRER